MPAVSVQLNAFLPAAPVAETRPGLLARLSAALEKARRDRIDREISLLIEREGGRISDGLERRIERHFI